MNLNVNLDWKFVLAFGAVAVSTIFAIKMDASEAENVSINIIEACKDYAIAGNSNR